MSTPFIQRFYRWAHSAPPSFSASLDAGDSAMASRRRLQEAVRLDVAMATPANVCHAAQQARPAHSGVALEMHPHPRALPLLQRLARLATPAGHLLVVRGDGRCFYTSALFICTMSLMRRVPRSRRRGM